MDNLKENHSVSAEQNIIGILLQRPDALDEIGKLQASDFWVQENRVLFETISLMVASGEEVDAVTVDETLKLTKRAEMSGGVAYLAELALNVPSVSNISRYARIVHDYATTRALIQAGAQIQKIADDNAPIESRIAKAQELMLSLDTVKSDRGARSIQEVTIECLTQIDSRCNGVAVTGLQTGLHTLDKITGGMQPGDMIILAGRPSSGKTALALNMACHIAKTAPVLFVSLEMSGAQLGQRVMANFGDIELGRIRYGTEYSSDEYDNLNSAVAQVQRLQMHIDEFANTTAQIASVARKIKRQSGLACIFIDYIGFIDGQGENQNIKVSRISAELKRIAKQMDVPVVALSQLNREVDKRSDKRPLMSDLRDSGSLEQDADIILMTYRDEYYYKDSNQNKGWAELLVRKNRQGETGTALVKFDGGKMRFHDVPVEQWHQYTPAKSQSDRYAGGGFE